MGLGTATACGGVLGRARNGACSPWPPQSHTPQWAQATSSSLVPDGGGPSTPGAGHRAGKAHRWLQHYLEAPRPGPHSKGPLRWAGQNPNTGCDLFRVKE